VAPVPAARGRLRRRPEVADDFVRNFLVRAGLTRTLDCFQEEWFEAVQSRRGGSGVVGSGGGAIAGPDVPDVYVQNQVLVEQVLDLERELARARDVAQRARATWSKFRKERDFHQMHHKRVAQEKGKLVAELQRLKKHYSSYQPLLEETRGKYERAMKDKMLMKLKAEQLETKVSQLETTIRQLEASRIPGHDDGDSHGGAAAATTKKSGAGGGGRGGTKKPPSGKRASGSSQQHQQQQQQQQQQLDFTALPQVAAPIQARDPRALSMHKTIRVHDLPCSAVAVHPTAPLAATASDDGSWKLVSLPDGATVLTGAGHTDWLSSVSFSCDGLSLATGSGDNTVRIWSLSDTKCTATLTGHAAAVWDVAHARVAGTVLASASMDKTARVWDYASGTCVSTMRGHADSVNGCRWIAPAVLATVSGDKTVSLWDARSGVCAHTLYGHANAVAGIAVSPDGSILATGDADGIVKIWDTRMAAERTSINAGPHPANALVIDPLGEAVMVCSDSGAVKMYALDGSDTLGVLQGHEEAVQGGAFDPAGKFFLTAGSDGTIRYWA
jgi:hypothetical protein